ncbi:MAG: DUF3520 domain-containing protein [Lentisphaerae bacterium]|nr:DUF3520 domain-containing protein [Lentisphaerota bacterium]
MNYKKLDRMLDELQQKNTPDPGKFDSPAEFKARFYRKLESANVSSKRHLKFYLTTAAAACVILGVIFIPAGLLRSSQQPTAVITGIDASINGSETAAATPTAAAAVPDKSNETGEADTPAEELPVQKTPAAAMVAVDSAVPVLNAPAASYAPVLAKKKMPQRRSLAAPRPGRAEYRAKIHPVKRNTEEYKSFSENNFVNVKDVPLSTFGADVDNGSYVNVRRYLLQQHQLPPRDAVRLEEFVNFFRYDYPQPEKDKRFSVTFESAVAPWNRNHKLLLIGVQAAEIPVKDLPPANYVFLVDNSGSMYEEMDKVQAALIALLDEMRPQDRLSLVTYGGGVKVLLDGITLSDKSVALNKIKELASGGYTPGADGIRQAYILAHKHFIRQGNNRIVLVTDGDFNVGVSSESELVAMVEKERSNLIYLSVFGMGADNYHENKLKMLANKGNGNYYYIDTLREAGKVMQACFAGRMFAIARDVKFQVEFNPAQIQAYRLLGYEMRTMADRDFNDDSKDGGEIGIGHQVTVLYEIVPVGAPAGAADGGKVDDLKYQTRTGSSSTEILTCKLRYQQPQSKEPSVLESFVLSKYPAAGNNLRWASAAAEFALLLRDSQYKGNANYQNLRSRAVISLGEDNDGKRAEFLIMVRNAMELSNKQ